MSVHILCMTLCTGSYGLPLIYYPPCTFRQFYTEFGQRSSLANYWRGELNVNNSYKKIYGQHCISNAMHVYILDYLSIDTDDELCIFGSHVGSLYVKFSRGNVIDGAV